MPYKATKQYSERGSLKDLARVQNEYSEPPTSYELRLRALYEESLLNKNSTLSDAAGFIVMPGSGNPSEYSVSIYKHREYINSLSIKLADKIEETRKELALYLEEVPYRIKMAQAKQQYSLSTILPSSNMVKIASKFGQPSFRRVS